MPRAEHRAGRGALVLVLSALLLLAGALSGSSAQAAAATIGSDDAGVRHTTDLGADLTGLAPQPHRVGHPQRVDDPALGVLPAAAVPTDAAWTCSSAADSTVQPTSAPRTDLRGRAPPT